MFFLRKNENRIHKMKRNVSAIVLFLLLSLFLNFTVAAAHYTFLQQGIAEEVVRFHVLANSDSEEDQAVKYLVRDAILTWIADEMQDAKEEPQSEQTERAAILQFLSENLSKLEENANRILEEQGKSYSAQAEIAWCYFPDRTYGSYTFPAGWYQALRIRLGEAAGQNWWCLLYPALCFSDCLHAAISDNGQTKLEENLTVEEYQLLLKNPSQWKIAFRWADFLN